MKPSKRGRPGIALDGLTFGRLSVRSRVPDGSKDWMWYCDCTCGGAVVATSSNLRSGRTRSCGCLQVESRAKPRTHGKSSMREFQAWYNMKKRCINPSHPSYLSYGGRGISVCPEWLGSFEAFYEHIGPRPSPDHSVDRINNNGNYEPGNVRWATRTQQQRNRRNTKCKP
jgi:hypothetical protein